jgi:hypothetical protein
MIYLKTFTITAMGSKNPHPKSLSLRERDFESGSLLPGEKGWG